jgi:hypothetical protein
MTERDRRVQAQTPAEEQPLNVTDKPTVDPLAPKKSQEEVNRRLADQERKARGNRARRRAVRLTATAALRRNRLLGR